MRRILPSLISLGIASCGSPSKTSPENAPDPERIHPKVFEMVKSWISDPSSPVVTEINLDAVAANRNQFDPDDVRREGPWHRWKSENGGEVKFRLMKRDGDIFTALCHFNGGGTLTEALQIRFALASRDIETDDGLRLHRILRVLSIHSVR
ncbi:MAG: hypothetical protein RL095_1985 [Verrucomicrobiota bacterium]|jgi:hypothetical protein